MRFFKGFTTKPDQLIVVDGKFGSGANSAPSSAGYPVHEKFDTLSAYQAAIDQVIANARRELRIFDYNLAESGFSSPTCHDQLKQFLLSNGNNRITIVVHETDYLTRFSPRLMNLLTQFSHAMQVYQTGPLAKRVYDPLIIGDDRHYVHRFHYEQPGGLLALDDHAGCLPLLQRFGEILENSEPAVAATTLGL